MPFTDSAGPAEASRFKLRAKFEPAAEIQCLLVHPFSPDVKGDVDSINDIEQWWTRTGLGAQLINMYCRAGIDAARELAITVIPQLPRLELATSQLSEEVNDAIFEERLKFVVYHLDTLTTWGRVAVADLQDAVTIRRVHPGTVLQVGTIIDDWSKQFVSVTPRDPSDMFRPCPIGNGELTGDYFELVWPPGATTINAWYIGSQEMVLPRGCTFTIVESLGPNRWQAEVRLPQTSIQTKPLQALSLDSVSAANKTEANQLIETWVLKELRRQQRRRQRVSTADEVADVVSALRDTLYSRYPGMTYREPYASIRRLLGYYYHIEDLVDIDALYLKDGANIRGNAV